MTRLEGEVAAEKMLKEQCEAEAAEKLVAAEVNSNAALNELRTQLQATEARGEELQQQVTRLEGEVAAEKLTREWPEAESDVRVRPAEDSDRAKINELMAQLQDAQAALELERAKYVACNTCRFCAHSN